MNELTKVYLEKMIHQYHHGEKDALEKSLKSLESVIQHNMYKIQLSDNFEQSLSFFDELQEIENQIGIFFWRHEIGISTQKDIQFSSFLNSFMHGFDRIDEVRLMRYIFDKLKQY